MIYLAIPFTAALVGWALTVLWFVNHLQTKDDREQQERADLLQRIQAPQLAVVQHATGHEPDMPQAVHPDSDEEYWEAHGVEWHAEESK